MKKNIILLVTACFSFLFANAQSETQSFNVGGIKVIFKPTSKNVINVRMYFRGGVTNYPANKAGIENITLAAAVRCGSGKYSAKSVRDTSDNYGILLSGVSTFDYGYLQVNCISKYFDQGWDLFSEAVTNPTFDAKEFDLLKNETISFNKEYRANPSNRLQELQRQSAFKNTPYATDPSGTAEYLGSLTTNDISNYYKGLLNKNRIFIVVVGNLTKQDVYEKVLGAFGNIPSGPYSPADLPSPVLKGNTLTSENSDLPTNYLGAIMNAPEYTSIFSVPFRMGMMGIGGNLIQYLRSDRSLSYSSSSNTFALRMPYAELNTGTANPKEAMFGMVKVLKNVQMNGFNEQWLQHLKSLFLTSSYINDQSASAITANLGLAEILGGWQYAEDLPKLVQMVTVDQVNMALNTYISGLKWTYLGNTDAIDGFTPPAY